MGSNQVTSEILDRQPPFNLDAEMGVLGSALLKPDVLDDISTLGPGDFYDDANRRLFEHLLAMHNDGRKIDSTLLVEKLKLAGDLERIGGVPYLARIANAVPNAAHAIYYATIVRENATYRALIDATTEVLRRAYEADGSAAEVLADAETRVLRIAERGFVADRTRPASAAVTEWLDEFDSRQNGKAPTGLMTGFSEIDKMTGGLRPGELVILAARPSVGKTACALNIAERVAVDDGVPVLFVSLEMSKIELFDRLHSSRGRVDSTRIRNGTCDGDERQRVIAAASEFQASPLLVDDSPAMTISQVGSIARRRKRQNGIKLLIIDYLQLIDPDNSKAPRQEQVAATARRLKQLAGELAIPVICLAQLNRQSEDNKDHVPKLSHLRESGAIEQDADVVMFVHRENYFLREKVAPGEAEDAQLIVAKQRNGPVGPANVMWFGSYCRFDNAAPRWTDIDNYTPAFDEFNEFSEATA